MADKTPEWKRQEELRAARRKPKKSRKPRPSGPVQVVDLCLVLRDRSKDSLHEAYRALRFSKRLVEYFPRYKYHKPCQLTVMNGRVVFTQVPMPVAQLLLKELTGGEKPWTQGSQKDLEEELLAIHERKSRRKQNA